MCPERKLVKISRNVYYIPGRTIVGVIVRDDWCMIVDTGIDEDYGRRIANIVGEAGLKIRYIFNTHSHADHIGGNTMIIKKTGAMLLAPQIESSLIENPVLEPILLYGSHPHRKLHSKFVMAHPSRVDKTLTEGFDRELNLGYVQLPGHSFNMFGLTVEDVFFTADSVFPENLVSKFKIIYHFNVRESVKTLEKIKNSSYSIYVPSHSEPVSSISSMVESNLKSIYSVRKIIEEISEKAISLEDLISTVLSELGVIVETSYMYFLYSSALKSYISWLVDEGFLKEYLEDGKVMYVRVG
ncbi:MAG: MBL fold metallo-hydrolase [Nitrososphaerota archaeon]